MCLHSISMLSVLAFWSSGNKFSLSRKNNRCLTKMHTKVLIRRPLDKLFPTSMRVGRDRYVTTYLSFDLIVSKYIEIIWFSRDMRSVTFRFERTHVQIWRILTVKYPIVSSKNHWEDTNNMNLGHKFISCLLTVPYVICLTRAKSSCYWLLSLLLS